MLALNKFTNISSLESELTQEHTFSALLYVCESNVSSRRQQARHVAVGVGRMYGSKNGICDSALEKCQESYINLS